jgi:hypothetical protein
MQTNKFQKDLEVANDGLSKIGQDFRKHGFQKFNLLNNRVFLKYCSELKKKVREI